MLGQLGSNKLEVLLVEFALQVTVHLVVVEGAVFAQRANVLDPVGTAGVSDAQWKLPSQNPNAGGGGNPFGGQKGRGLGLCSDVEIFSTDHRTRGDLWSSARSPTPLHWVSLQWGVQESIPILCEHYRELHNKEIQLNTRRGQTGNKC